MGQDAALDLPVEWLGEAADAPRPDVGSTRDEAAERTDDAGDAPVLPSGLVAYYPCEGADGTSLPDFSGSGLHAALLVGATADGGTLDASPGYGFDAGRVGQALVLSQAGSGYVALPPEVFNGASAITIAFWIKPITVEPWQRVFDIGVNAHSVLNPATGSKYLDLVPLNGSTPGMLAFGITDNGFNNEKTLKTTALDPSGGWQHIVVSLDGAQGTLYVNGSQVQTSATMSLRPADLGTIDYAYIGRSPWSNDPYLDAEIDEVRIYHRALTPAEVQAVFQFAGP